MDENDIVEAVRSIKLPPKKLSEMWPEYPCDKCPRGKGNCTMFRDCVGWLEWYHNRFVEIDEMFKVVRKRGKR